MSLALPSLDRHSIHAQFHNHVNSERHLVNGDVYKHRRSAALAE
jgi:hypothetical protein